VKSERESIDGDNEEEDLSDEFMQALNDEQLKNMKERWILLQNLRKDKRAIARGPGFQKNANNSSGDLMDGYNASAVVDVKQSRGSNAAGAHRRKKKSARGSANAFRLKSPTGATSTSLSNNTFGMASQNFSTSEEMHLSDVAAHEMLFQAELQDAI
jgi:hypothetical protein